MSVTLAVAAVRLAKLDTLVQQMSAPEALAAVDTICVDKTGTLTTGELELISVDVADPSAGERRPAGPGALRRQLRRAEPDPGGDRGDVPGDRRAGPRRRSRSPPSGSGAASPWARGETYVLGAPDVLMARGSLSLPVPLEESLQEHTRNGRRVVAFGRAGAASRTTRTRIRRRRSLRWL